MDTNQTRQQFLVALSEVNTLSALLVLEQTYFSRASGILTGLMKSLKDLAPEDRASVGQSLNILKAELENALESKKLELQNIDGDLQIENERIDVTAPSILPNLAGHIHPLSQLQKSLEDFFTSMGFIIADGPELETDWFNFTALNVPPHHPARDSQDTFYIKNHSDWVMRTQTSPVQIRALLEHGAPIRMIAPGRVFRNESTDARHEHTFYQVEGMVVDKGISFAHLKGVLEALTKHIYGPAAQLRLRPKYYPFVEPGVNGEVTCTLCAGNGCQVCKYTGWLEIFGAGMVHPNVLREGNIDPEVYSGFAFGLGLNRLVMLEHGIEDVRHFLNGDLRFLNQF